MIICGLDLSTSVAGWSRFVDGHLEDYGYYSFKKEKDWDYLDLLLQFEEGVLPRFRDADTVVIEDSLKAYGRATSSIAKLIAFNAVCTVQMQRELDADIIKLHPSTARKKALNRGRAPKGQKTKQWVLQEVGDRYGIEWPLTRYDNIRTEAEDMADSIVLAMTEL